jgi:DNA polymerase III delta subunit
VREVAANSREYTLNEYVGHALNRDRKRALAVLRRLLDWGEEPIRIIAWLVNGLLGCIGGRADGPWNPNELNRALNQLYDVNRLIVTGYPEPYLLLEAFTVCLACGERSRTCRLRLRSNPPGICLLRPRSQAVRRMAANG